MESRWVELLHSSGQGATRRVSAVCSLLVAVSLPKWLLQTFCELPRILWRLTGTPLFGASRARRPDSPRVAQLRERSALPAAASFTRAMKGARPARRFGLSFVRRTKEASAPLRGEEERGEEGASRSEELPEAEGEEESERRWEVWRQRRASLEEGPFLQPEDAGEAERSERPPEALAAEVDEDAAKRADSLAKLPRL